jgi:hypothetical protein
MLLGQEVTYIMILQWQQIETEALAIPVSINVAGKRHIKFIT